MEYMITRQGDDPEKLENDKGEIAVIYSSKYGSGWSTYGMFTGNRVLFEKMLFNPQLAIAIISKQPEQIKKAIVEQFPELTLYGGTWLFYYQFSIRWIEKGLRFVISEYNGLETITTEDEIDFITA